MAERLRCLINSNKLQLLKHHRTANTDTNANTNKKQMQAQNTNTKSATHQIWLNDFAA